MSPKLNGMFVTPKDIDETVKRLAGLLSEEALTKAHEETQKIVDKYNK